MQIIPVLDLKGGLVVRARMGQRDLYQPIRTPLSATSDPIDVARGLMTIHTFDTFYIADLDAIEGRGDNAEIIDRLRRELPGVAFWVDSGIAELDRACDWLAAQSDYLVLGSESQIDSGLVRAFADHARVVLSLDFRGERFAGPDELLAEPGSWPRRLIVMTLARVGSGAGPDLDRLSRIRTMAARRRVYAAGGVRDKADLAALNGLGISGALVATSLHDGRLRNGDFLDV
jgi:phosphoribosylformimino-5-aminoimidazole carboxamide ribotide isomerase